MLMVWTEFLSIRDESEMIAMQKKDLPEELRKAFEELEELSKDPAMRVVALNREIELRDQVQRLSDAIEKGREEGALLTTLAFAKKMKSQGFSLEQIEALTGLSLKELESL